jgi:uridine kinase
VGLVEVLARLIEQRRGDQDRFAVAVDGPDAAGKTTLAASLTVRLGEEAVAASMDGFHHLRAIRHRLGRASAEGYYRETFDHATAISDLLTPFRDGAPTVRVAAVDYDTDLPISPTVEVAPRAVLVVDGVFLQLPALRPFWDLVVYLRVSPELSRERGMARDARRGDVLDDLAVRYRDRYLPGQAMYRAECDPEETADVLVDMTDLADPVVVRAS